MAFCSLQTELDWVNYTVWLHCEVYSYLSAKAASMFGIEPGAIE